MPTIPSSTAPAHPQTTKHAQYLGPTAPQLPYRFFHRFLAPLLSFLLIALPAAAAPLRLADEPVRLDTAGVFVRVPEGAALESRTLGAQQVTTVRLPQGLGTIVLQARPLPENEPAPAADEFTRRLAAQLLALPDPGDFNPDRDRPSTAAGAFLGPGPRLSSPAGPVRPLYLRLRGRAEDAIIERGIAAFIPAPDRVVLIDLLSSPDRAADARQTFEAVLSSVLARNPEAAERTSEIERRQGAALLASITPERFAEVIRSADPYFERLYRPADGAAAPEEVGYRRTAARPGFRGEVAGKPRDRWARSDNDEGTIVTVDARLLGDNGQRIDSKAIYFLDHSRRDETWAVQMSVRGDGPTTTWTEIGAREGRNLTVNIAQGTTARRSVNPSIRVEGYLSRVEAILLPRLLAEAGEPGEFTFASYDSQREGVVERTEVFERSPEGWTLRTTFEDGRAQTTVVRPDGATVRTTLDSGLIWEPIEFDRLFRLWSSKGLPVD